MSNLRSIQPFANDSDSVNESGLTIENGTDTIAIYGQLDLNKDKPGLEHARGLKAFFEKVVLTLEKENNLPGKATAPDAPLKVPNPLA